MRIPPQGIPGFRKKMEEDEKEQGVQRWGEAKGRWLCRCLGGSVAMWPAPHKAATGKGDRDLVHGEMWKSLDREHFRGTVCVQSRLEWAEE